VDVEQAQLNLSYVNIVAPQDGWVTRKSVAVGDYISVGQRVMSIVLTDLWVTANFKETQLRRIRVGQRVEMTVDSVAGRKYSGRVQSIQAGSGARFSLLPPENAVGNYVKVVQRVPVKIVFDELAAADHVLGPGMSVAPSIKVTDYDIPESVVVLAALVLACAAGVFWRKMAGQTHG
jgi:membrane fusion protein (multidrug efflux system)